MRRFFRLSLRELALIMTAICAALGAYSLGKDRGRHLGYHESRDRFNLILQANAENVDSWDHIGHLLRAEPGMQITGEQPMGDERLRAYREQIKPGVKWSEVAEEFR